MVETANDKLDTYLTFTLAEETYAVDVRNVREVLDQAAITRVPRAPEFMRGVINLRGAVVPILDMRRRLGLPPAPDGAESCIVVMEVELQGEPTVVGALGDQVREVFELPASAIEPPPRIGTNLDNRFLKGMGKRDEQFLLILDADKLFAGTDITGVEAEEQLPQA